MHRYHEAFLNFSKCKYCSYVEQRRQFLCIFHVLYRRVFLSTWQQMRKCKCTTKCTTFLQSRFSHSLAGTNTHFLDDPPGASCASQRLLQTATHCRSTRVPGTIFSVKLQLGGRPQSPQNLARSPRRQSRQQKSNCLDFALNTSH